VSRCFRLSPIVVVRSVVFGPTLKLVVAAFRTTTIRIAKTTEVKS
jgi:hypothetical protein